MPKNLKLSNSFSLLCFKEFVYVSRYFGNIYQNNSYLKLIVFNFSKFKSIFLRYIQIQHLIFLNKLLNSKFLFFFLQLIVYYVQCFIRCLFEKSGFIENWKLNAKKIRENIWPAMGDTMEVCEKQGCK